MRRAVVLAITLASGAARAHVAPSVDDNNRYLKLTPAADRVRLAYTVFFGEVPGAQARRTIDADRDGAISDAEGQAFGLRIAGEVAAALEVELDGRRQPVAWSLVSVGMGTPRVAGGAFSIDLVASFCLTAPGPRHELRLFDRFRIPRPGETEVKVEDATGIAIARARVGDANDPSRDYRFVGPGGPLADDGLDLAFDVTPRARPGGDGACAGSGGGGASTAAVAGVIVVVGLGAAAAAVALVRSRRRARGPKRPARRGLRL